jgi:hypothetical protein
MIKTIAALALCATALSSAAPALAQGYAPPRDGEMRGAAQPGHGLREQLDQLDARIRQGIQSGDIDRGEADRANRELGSIREEMMRLRAQGGELSDMDRGRLQERLDSLSRSIHCMREHGPVAGQPNVPPPRYDDHQPMNPGMSPGMNQGMGAWTLERREAWMQERIDHARADGTLTRRDAYRAQASLNQVKALQARMLRRGHGQLRDVDRQYLEQRLDHVRDTMRWLRQSNETAPWARP